jgi:hypothetical protein
MSLLQRSLYSNLKMTDVNLEGDWELVRGQVEINEFGL